MSKKMTLGKKLTLGFSLPLFIMVCIVGGIYVISDTVESNATLAKDESVVFAATARQMKLDAV